MGANAASVGSGIYAISLPSGDQLGPLPLAARQCLAVPSACMTQMRPLTPSLYAIVRRSGDQAGSVKLAKATSGVDRCKPLSLALTTKIVRRSSSGGFAMRKACEQDLVCECECECGRDGRTGERRQQNQAERKTLYAASVQAVIDGGPVVPSRWVVPDDDCVAGPVACSNHAGRMGQAPPCHKEGEGVESWHVARSRNLFGRCARRE